MKPNLFNHTILAVGVAAAMGVSTLASAATQTDTATGKIKNIASATYSVGTVEQIRVDSNPVEITVSETAAFSLVAINGDSDSTGDYNDQVEVAPEGIATFKHKLSNNGNLTDTYTMQINQDGSTPTTPTDSKDYSETSASSSVSYTIYNEDNSVAQAEVTKTPAEFYNSKITLEKGQYAEITINATTEGNVGGDTQNATLSATSEYFTNDTTANNETLTNVNNSVTKLPAYQIVKSVDNTLDLNNPNDVATYTIRVTNNAGASYAADALDAKVIDNLPAGLELVAAPTFTFENTGNGLNSAGTPSVTKDGAGTSSANDGFVIPNVNLEVGATIVITFEVKKDANEDFETDPIINHAKVEDDLDNNPDTLNTIIDSTDSGDQNTSKFYPSGDDSEVTDGSAPSTPAGDSTQELTANKRGLTLSGPTEAEVPNTSTEVTQGKHATLIKNTGEEIEGDESDEVKFSITDQANSPNISLTTPVTIEYNPTGVEGGPTQEFTFPEVPSDGIYDLSDAVAADKTPFPGMDPKSTVTIKYEVSSTNATSGNEDGENPTTGESETTIVKLIPGGIDKPTTGNFEVTDKTIVKGLSLIKTQALDADCNGVADGVFSDSEITTVNPGHCVIYNIEANNPFSEFDITDLLIFDTTARFTGKAVYNNDGTIKIGSTAATNTGVNQGVPNSNIVDEDAIYTTISTLAAGESATLVFSVKINETGGAK